MAERFLNAVLARLRLAAANLQRLPLIALLLLAATAGAQLVLAPGRRAAIDDAEQRLARLERSARRAALARESGLASPEATRQRLLERFPTRRQLNAELGRLIALATSQGLEVERGDYRLLPGQDGLFDRYVLNLPVTGSYPLIRRYVAAARQAFPDLAVEDLSLRRETIASTEVEAQLRFVVFGRRNGS